MTKYSFKYGFLLFGITMLLFFVVYYFFANQNYWDISVTINSFVLPIIYGIMAFISVFIMRKRLGEITFPQAFAQSFYTLFVGGLLSLLSIFAYLNYGDTQARDLLNYQFVETQAKKLEEARVEQLEKSENLKDAGKMDDVKENYKNYKIGIEAAKNNKTNFFSFKYLSALFGVILLFYVFLSIAIAAFLKNKKRYE